MKKKGGAGAGAGGSSDGDGSDRNATSQDVSGASQPRIVNGYSSYGARAEGAINNTCRAFVTVAKKELRATAEECQFLEQLTTVQSAAFSELKDNLSQLDEFSARLTQRGAAMQPYLDSIGELEASVDDLEHLVEALDRASWQLDTRLRQL